MPTFQTTRAFERDLRRLASADRERFKAMVLKEFVPDLVLRSFRPGLRVKGVQGAPGVFELMWAPNGRATWQFGQEVVPGEPHVIWRRVGTHAIFNPGPP